MIERINLPINFDLYWVDRIYKNLGYRKGFSFIYERSYTSSFMFGEFKSYNRHDDSIDIVLYRSYSSLYLVETLRNATRPFSGLGKLANYIENNRSSYTGYLIRVLSLYSLELILPRSKILQDLLDNGLYKCDKWAFREINSKFYIYLLSYCTLSRSKISFEIEMTQKEFRSVKNKILYSLRYKEKGLVEIYKTFISP